MFLWVTSPEGVDAGAMLQEAIARKVLFVPGRDSFPDGPTTRSGERYLRLNFSNATEEKIRIGIGRLAEVAGQALAGVAG